MKNMSDPAQATASLRDHLFVTLQRLLPTHALSRVIHWATRLRWRWAKNLLIGKVVQAYDIKLDDALVEDALAYASFNKFFTRELKSGARPMPEAAEVIASPVDGTLYQAGDINGERIFQAKGHHFTSTELLGGDASRAGPFMGGKFATIYLAPYNYHRIHMPVNGRLREMVYIPGRLFSVNPATARTLPGLFARNERVAMLFDTDAGPMAMVAVGALFVGSIETVWAGEITPPHRGGITVTQYMHGDDAHYYARGDEVGRFNMGSTVILLFGAEAVRWVEDNQPGRVLRMGDSLALPGGI